MSTLLVRDGTKLTRDDENQCVFDQDRVCTDQLLSLRVLIENAREFLKPIYIASVTSERLMIL